MQQPAQLDIFNGSGTEADALGQPASINGNPPVVLPSIRISYAQSSGDGIEFRDLPCGVVNQLLIISANSVQCRFLI
jgi:hypothetical protein